MMMPKTLQDFVDEEVLDILYDLGLSVDEGIEAGLISRAEATPFLRHLEEDWKRFDSIYDCDEQYGIDGIN